MNRESQPKQEKESFFKRFSKDLGAVAIFAAVGIALAGALFELGDVSEL